MLIVEQLRKSYHSRAKRYDTSRTSLSICSIGLVVHFSFIFLFAHWGVASLSYFNIISASMWAWAIFEISRGYTYRSIYIASTEILAHALFAVSILGIDSGFDLYLLPLAAWVAYHPNVKHTFSLLFGASCILLWILGHAYWSYSPNVDFPETVLRSMFVANTVFSGIAFVVAIISARLLVEAQQEQLLEQAIKDKLTGLYNRHYLLGYVEKNVRQLNDESWQYGLILIDIDHFKAINDTYGHHGGDAVLQKLATILNENIRTGDLACRWGGEEFIIVLQQCSLEQTVEKAEQLRHAIASVKFDVGEQVSIDVTASFGVVKRENNEPFSTVISKADAQLYIAKAAGRNQVAAPNIV